MVACYLVGQDVAIGAARLVELPHGPQRASGGVGFLTPAHFAFDVRIGGVGQSHMALKPGPVFAKVMPQTRQAGPTLCRLSRVKCAGKLSCQCSDCSQMIEQQVPT